MTSKNVAAQYFTMEVSWHWWEKNTVKRENITNLFPDNRSMAEARHKNLKERFSRDKQYHEDYIRFMEDMVQKGYAEKSFQQVQQSKTWFIPHHGIYHPSKLCKIWVIFDYSAEYNGVSVNEKLMAVPDLINQIISILVKFREDFVAIMTVVEAMFCAKCPLVGE